MVDEREIFVRYSSKYMLRGPDYREEGEVRTLRPALIIGLGGTGAEVVARLKRMIQRYYQRLGDEGAAMIRYLVLDAQPLDVHTTPEVRSGLHDGEDYFFLGGFVPDEYVNERLREGDQDLRDWWDPRYRAEGQTVAEGAKRVRQVGRLALYSRHLDVEQMIAQHLARSREIDERISQTYNLLPFTAAYPIYIISSTCGGTGSGMFLDVAFKAWNAAHEQTGRAPELRGVTFMPAVFEDVARLGTIDLRDIHRANAFALLKEFEYLLTHPEEIEIYCLDAHTRQEQKARRHAGWIPAHRLYLVDRQLGDIGVITDRADLYKIAADALLLMLVSPLGAQERSAGRNIEDFLKGDDRGRPRRYLSFGVSSLLYPLATILTRLAGRYATDVLNALLRDEPWMVKLSDKAATEKLDELRKPLAEIGSKTQDVLQLAAQTPTDRALRRVPLHERLARVTAERDGAERLVGAGVQRIKDTYLAWKPEAVKLMRQQVALMVNGSTHGVASTQKTLYKIRALMSEDLQRVKTRRGAAEAAAAAALEEVNRQIAALGRLTADWWPNRLQRRAFDRAVAAYSQQLRVYVESSLSAEIARRQEDFVGALVGAATVQEVQVEGVAVERMAVQSLFDEEIGRVNAMIAELTRLRDLAEDLAFDEDFVPDERSVSKVTQVFPPRSGGRGDRTLGRYVEHVYAEVAAKLYDTTRVPGAPPLLGEELKRSLLSVDWRSGDQVIPDKLYALGSSDPQAVARAREALVELLVARAGTLFSGIVDRPVLDVALEHAGEQPFRNLVMPNLLHQSQPCWALDRATSGSARLPRTFAIGYAKEHIDRLMTYLPAGPDQPAKVSTHDRHQASLLQVEYAAALHEVRGFYTMRSSYRAKRPGEVLHLHRNWSRGETALIEDESVAFVEPKVAQAFALGLFTDYLARRKDADFQAHVVPARFDEEVTGHIFSRDGRFLAARYERSGDTLRAAGTVHLGVMDRASALAEYNTHTDLLPHCEMLVEHLIARKGSDAVRSHLDEYIAILKEDLRESQDREVRSALRNEIEALTEYLKELAKRKRRGEVT